MRAPVPNGVFNMTAATAELNFPRAQPAPVRFFPCARPRGGFWDSTPSIFGHNLRLPGACGLGEPLYILPPSGGSCSLERAGAARASCTFCVKLITP